MKYFILLGTYLYYFKTFSKEFYINDSGAIETQIMETSDKILRNVINNTNGVFTTNSKFNGTSKCIGSYFYEKQKNNSEKTLNGLREYSVSLKDNKLVLTSVTRIQSWELSKKSLVYRDKEWGEDKDEVIRYWKRVE